MVICQISPLGHSFLTVCKGHVYDVVYVLWHSRFLTVLCNHFFYVFVYLIIFCYMHQPSTCNTATMLSINTLTLFVCFWRKPKSRCILLLIMIIIYNKDLSQKHMHTFCCKSMWQVGQRQTILIEGRKDITRADCGQLSWKHASVWYQVKRFQNRLRN